MPDNSTLTDRLIPTLSPAIPGLACFASVSSVQAYWPRGYEGLSTTEQDSVSRMIRAEDRAQRAAAHILKRRVLGHILGVSPECLEFDQDRNGRPFLRHPESTLDFNISHAGNWVALSVISCRAQACGTGVDVEAQRPQLDWTSLSEDFLSPAEIRIMNELDYDQGRLFALSRWSMKEAIVKATGEGLGATLSTITPTVHADGTFHCNNLNGYTIACDGHHVMGAAVFPDTVRAQVIRLDSTGWGQATPVTQPHNSSVSHD
ncbi:4'-phosphopantetheinyl transferase superfamily protein [Haematospirillum sp. H1815]|uniref:4'-phosphopantetheinyl transferase family protein n=1 Tax=Haematospirillum sp. H1815 TaxID=2723108 RepID=UPI00143B99F5|nr:4'-phosphopantetheinyl transferase superfamily protein [Haematospirillum sp. H1815]NKD77696.1 4'-phosphopantetheinyl transferase superfamily protein [Haematospirillum sp. H1815]